MAIGERQQLGWSQNLEAIASQGLRSASDPYDRDRHEQIRQIATLLQDGDTGRWACALEGLAKTGWSLTASDDQRSIYSEVLNIAGEMSDGAVFFGPATPPRSDGSDPSIAGVVPRYKTPGVSAMAIVVETSQILLVQRADNGMWSPPGGFCDPGFSGAEVAAKEVAEETGITVDITALLGVSDDMQRDPQVCQYGLIYLAQPVAGTLTPNRDECAGAAWFEADEIPDDLHLDGIPWLELARNAIAGTVFPAHFDKARPIAIDLTERRSGISQR